MSDFRQPTPDYMAQELESERVKLEEVFFGGYRRRRDVPDSRGRRHLVYFTSRALCRLPDRRPKR